MCRTKYKYDQAYALEAVAMDRVSQSKQQLLSENEALKNRLAESEETLEAIRTGAVDALVVSDKQGERIFTLQSSDYSFRVMAENMNEGAVVLNNDGIVVFANNVFAGLAKREMSTIVGTPINDHLTSSPRRALSAFLQKCTDRPCRGEFFILRPQSGAIPVVISGTSFAISGRRNICLIAGDLREHKEAERKLRTAYDEVEKKVVERTQELQSSVQQLCAANRELGSFNLSVAHDLRNPLQAILSCVSVLSGSKTYVAKDEQIAIGCIRQMTERMSMTLHDLLSLSRISGKDMQATVVLLSVMAQHLIEAMKASNPQQEAEVIIMPGLTAWADERLTRILLENLLLNAWKFSSKCLRARIEFGATHHKDQQVYFVRDNGVGFDMAAAGLMFEPFKQFHSRDEFPGAGIGLAIVKRIVQRHGGCVWAESEPGKGATFYFTLPACT